MHCVGTAFGLCFAGMTFVAGIWRHTEISGTLFVIGDDPGLASGGGSFDPLESALMRGAPIVLEGETGEDGIGAEERSIDTILFLGIGVQDGEMIVRIVIANEASHGAMFGGGLGVFLAEIPIEREEIAEARDHFAEIKFSFAAESPAIESGGDGLSFAFGTEAGIVHFGFLELEMEIESALLGVIENDLPLVELGDVVVQFLFARDEGPDVVAITTGVVGEE